MRLEFKRAFPQQARDLAKEAAAFASSGGGVILLGVADDGGLLGVIDATTADGRDELQRRIRGIMRVVDPGLTMEIRFAFEDAHAVVVVQIEAGSEPMYFFRGIPYLRDGTESRPATAVEVKAAHREWFEQELDDTSEAVQFTVALADNLAAIWASKSITDDDMLDSQVLELKTSFAFAFAGVRELAVTECARDLELQEPLSDLARALDEVTQADNWKTMPGWRDFMASIGVVHDLATAAREQLCDWEYVERLEQPALARLSEVSRKLQLLVTRLPGMIEAGRIERMRDEGALIGREIEEVAFVVALVAADPALNQVNEVGRALHRLACVELSATRNHASEFQIEIEARARDLADGVRRLEGI